MKRLVGYVCILCGHISKTKGEKHKCLKQKT